MARFWVIADEEANVGRERYRCRGNDEESEFEKVGHRIPIGGEVENEPHSHERGTDDRKERNEFGGGSFFLGGFF